MRGIEFRGKRIDNEKWIYGSLLDCKERGLFISVYNPKYADAMDSHPNGTSYSVPNEVISNYKVIPESVGQYIMTNHRELGDKKRIYEGDIDENGMEFFWKKNNMAFFVREVGTNVQLSTVEFYLFIKLRWEDIKVIGNTTDNPELLKEKA